MGIWQALTDRRAADEENRMMYEDLFGEIAQFYIMAKERGDASGALVKLEDFVDGMVVGYSLAIGKDKYTLKIQCPKGLPGVSFLGGTVDSVEYCITKKLSEATISAHRSDTNESTTISSRVSIPSFWREINGLTTKGVNELRRLAKY